MSRALYDILQANFGVKTTFNINPVVAQVETTVTKILSGNPNRLGYLIINTGTATIFISPNNPACQSNFIIWKWRLHDNEMG